MKTYANILIVNGEEFTHAIKANSYKEALEENKKRKRNLQKGRQIKGHLVLTDW